MCGKNNRMTFFLQFHRQKYPLKIKVQVRKTYSNKDTLRERERDWY